MAALAGPERFVTMANIDQPAETGNSAITTPTVSATTSHDRAWWAHNSRRAGTDWQGLGEAMVKALASAGINEPVPSTLQRASELANRGRQKVSDGEIIEPKRLERLRRMMADNVSLDQAWHELRDNRDAPRSTIDALMYGLRERGVATLNEPAAQRRLLALGDEQVREVCGRLQRLKPESARPWSADEVETLISTREELRHG
jgi:hypothetical protein